MKYLILGEETMVGRYLRQVLGKEGSGVVPGSDHEQAVVFVCGGIEESGLEALAGAEQIVYVSSHEVYSPDAGEGVDESRPAFAWSEDGKRHARAELMLEKWCAAKGMMLTIVRPALMFGSGVDGWLLRLFNRVIRGHYVHIRGNDAKVSLVTALDTARAMAKLTGKPGIYNVSDGKPHRWIDVVEAMTANAGAQKRMTHLPEKWARLIYKWFGRLPIVEECLSPEALEPFSRTCVLDNRKVAEATGLVFFDTLEVIARRDKGYPYECRM